MELPEFSEMRSWAMDLWGEALEIWGKGGWAMFAIAFISMFMAVMGFHVWARLRSRRLRRVSEKRWRKWLKQPELRKGRLGEVMDFVLNDRSLKEASLYFDQIRATESAPFERDLKVMNVCVGAAPLVGLLGTVTGMLSTFGALSTGSGGDQTMGMIAAGISEALITTETGLVIALPGLFFHHFLERKFADYKLFLSHLETVCSQEIYRREEAKIASVFSEDGEMRSRLRERIRARHGKKPHEAVAVTKITKVENFDENPGGASDPDQDDVAGS